MFAFFIFFSFVVVLVVCHEVENHHFIHQNDEMQGKMAGIFLKIFSLLRLAVQQGAQRFFLGSTRSRFIVDSVLRFFS
jgi:hypothetical protein